MWPKHLVPDDAHGGIESLPLLSASAHPEPNPQEFDCGCVTVLSITDADALKGGQPFEMRLASACGRRDCLVTVDPAHALAARRIAVNRLLGYDVPVHALDSREQQLTVLLDAAITELRRITTIVGYDRGEVAAGDTITLADATQTLLELRDSEIEILRANVKQRGLAEPSVPQPDPAAAVAPAASDQLDPRTRETP